MSGSTETKASFQTTELAVYVLAVLGVLISSTMTDYDDTVNAVDSNC